MTFSLQSPSTQRAVGRWAWAMAWVGLIGGQLHALARFATDEGRADLELPLTAAWAEPAADLLGPLLEWGDPDLVYVSYGKLWLPVFLTLTLCAAVVRRRRAPRGIESWVWRLVVAGYAGMTVGVLLGYWTQWSGEYNAMLTAGFVASVLGLMLTLLGSTALGVTLLAKGARPLLPSLLLALCLPLAVGIAQVTSLGNTVLPVVLAFGLLGREISRSPHAPQNATVGGASWPAGAS